VLPQSCTSQATNTPDRAVSIRPSVSASKRTLPTGGCAQSTA
jgi:hypothetical protein